MDTKTMTNRHRFGVDSRVMGWVVYSMPGWTSSSLPSLDVGTQYLGDGVFRARRLGERGTPEI